MKKSPRYLIEPLSKHHNRTAFCCGIETLDMYLHKYAGQDIRRHVTATFVLILEDTSAIAGYYTLSATGITLGKFPEEMTKHFSKYPLVPATLLGRLAVDQTLRGQGLGEILLVDALRRSLHHSQEIASMAVIVDAFNEDACAFYAHFGFRPFPDNPDKLFLSMKNIEESLPDALKIVK